MKSDRELNSLINNNLRKQFFLGEIGTKFKVSFKVSPRALPRMIRGVPFFFSIRFSVAVVDPVVVVAVAVVAER